MDKLKLYIHKIVNFSENEMDAFLSLFSEKQMSKNDYFSSTDEYSTKLGFLKNGVMRAFHTNKDGKEYNKTFFTKDNFVGAYSSLTSGQKNLINIQCLTDCTILVADYGKITGLYTEYQNIETFARKFAEIKFGIKEKREIEFVTLEATERYAIFQKEHPNVENLIPQYQIASYLGITPTQLSRIRAKK